jgi:hypothetical protein
MNTMKIYILNPKASKLIKNLEDLNLISIKKSTDDGFLTLVNKLRARTKNNPPTLAEITKEVELVRVKRYAKSKK